jgi:hypothetical protein
MAPHAESAGDAARRLIGSPDTIREKLREFEATNVDQIILLNQTGHTSHEDICQSLALFTKHVMPEFQAREPEHQRWKADVLEGRASIEQLDTFAYTVDAHQDDDIVRLTPEALKRKMAAKDAAQVAAGGGGTTSGTVNTTVRTDTAPCYTFNSFLSSFRKRQSVPCARIF